jgi:SSS family solute:Na+ symporter
VNQTYPSWFMGFVGAAGAVTAMVPAAILVLFASTLISKNVYKAGFDPHAGEEKVMRLSRIMVIVIMTLSLLFALFLTEELVNLLILGYDGVCQFFPGVVLGLFWKRVNRSGVLLGLISGVALVMVLILSGNDPFLGLNAGFVGLILNVGVTVSMSLVKKESPELKISRT